MTDDPQAILATCPQCHQVVRFMPDPARLGPSGRDRSGLWTCPNPTSGYVAEFDELSEHRVEE